MNYVNRIEQDDMGEVVGSNNGSLHELITSMKRAEYDISCLYGIVRKHISGGINAIVFILFFMAILNIFHVIHHW